MQLTSNTTQNYLKPSLKGKYRHLNLWMKMNWCRQTFHFPTRPISSITHLTRWKLNSQKVLESHPTCRPSSAAIIFSLCPTINKLRLHNQQTTSRQFAGALISVTRLVSWKACLLAALLISPRLIALWTPKAYGQLTGVSKIWGRPQRWAAVATLTEDDDFPARLKSS